MSIYTQEHRIFQESIRNFCDKELRPNLNQWEEEKFFPNSVFEKLGQEGYLGILIGEKWGGVGGDYILASSWCEEFGKLESVGLSVAINMHSVVVSPTLERLGSEQSKEKFLKGAVLGKSIGAYAFTEPGAGSDLSSIRTKATKRGDKYILNGSKTFITNGKRASFVLVLAKTDDSKGYDGFTVFVVDTTKPGFQVNRTIDKLGWHSSDTAELSFTDIELEQSDVLGEIGKGWIQAMQSLEWERIMLTLGAIGGASKCIEQTKNYANDRKAFGRSILDFELNKSRLNNLESKLIAARESAHNCVYRIQNGFNSRKEVSMAKYHSCSLAIDIADLCLQLHGGYGYTTEFPPERWLRDLRLNTIGGGTNEIMSKAAIQELLRT